MSLRSMTGYACVENELFERTLRVEARSVNSRYLDVKLRIPDSLANMEARIQGLIKRYFMRGRLEVSIILKPSGDDVGISWDRDKATAYIKLFKEMTKELDIPGGPELSLLLNQKDVMLSGNSFDPDNDVWPDIEPVLSKCFHDLATMRDNEGAALAEDIISRIEKVGELTDRMEKSVKGVAEEHVKRLKKRVREMLGDDVVIDESRLVQEAAVVAERSDITEELVRLRSHSRKFLDMMSEDGPLGRKLEFLVQEMHRESNTIGSKAQNAEVSQVVVEVKSELERIREQLQNIE